MSSLLESTHNILLFCGERYLFFDLPEDGKIAE